MSDIFDMDKISKLENFSVSDELKSPEMVQAFLHEIDIKTDDLPTMELSLIAALAAVRRLRGEPRANEEFDFDAVRLAAGAAAPGEHIYTNPRDHERWKENETWHEIASPELFMALLRAKQGQEAALAVIAWMLDDNNQDYNDDRMHFLHLWNEGEFDILRREWPEAPEAIYIGADQFHPQTIKA